jgi:hypothetical protein
MARSGTVLRNTMVVGLMHSQSELSPASLMLSGLTRTDTRILSSLAPAFSHAAATSSPAAPMAPPAPCALQPRTALKTFPSLYTPKSTGNWQLPSPLLPNQTTMALHESDPFPTDCPRVSDALPAAESGVPPGAWTDVDGDPARGHTHWQQRQITPCRSYSHMHRALAYFFYQVKYPSPPGHYIGFPPLRRRLRWSFDVLPRRTMVPATLLASFPKFIFFLYMRLTSHGGRRETAL